MKPKRKAEWAEAQRRCRLSDQALTMAKELGLSPHGLIKNIPNRSEPWKAPVEDWVRRMYLERFGRTTPQKPGSTPKPDAPPARPPLLSPGPRADTAAGAHPATAPSARNLLREAEEELLKQMDRREVSAESFSELMSEIERETPVSEGEIEEQNRFMLQRWQSFRHAAEKVAAAFAQVSFVQKVMLIGSVAAPLKKEVPRFYRLRRASVKIWHECKDVDLAVWVSDLTNLRQLKKVMAKTLNEINQNLTTRPGVAHHQVDVFLFEPGTDRYRGNLCHYGECPKGKPDCEVAGCGAQLFLQLYEDFKFDRWSLFAEHNVVLFERQPTAGAPGNLPEEIPF